MVPTLKSEFKKFLTVRSTYVIAVLIVFLAGLFTYLGTSRVYEEPAQPVKQSQQAEGQASQASKPVEEPKLTNKLPPQKILINLQNTIEPLTFLISILVILLMAHEFRYNTITYTLTMSNSRSKVLGSKIAVSIVIVVVLAALAIATTIATTYAAVSIKGLVLPTYDIDWPYMLARLFSYTLGFSLFGLALITLLRNLTAGIVILFFLPNIEILLASFLASHNIEPTKYLPFSALMQIHNVTSGSMGWSVMPVSVPRAYLVFAFYLIPLWIITWLLFLRRDAS
jgi:ABC-type transport system involved in multi-copper enzyme maturation permease subunit